MKIGRKTWGGTVGSAAWGRAGRRIRILQTLHLRTFSTLPHPEGWATDPSRFAIAAARRSSKEIASVSCDCWSRGGVYILHGLCLGCSFRLRDDEKRSNELAQFCMFFGPFGGNFGLLGWPRGLLRPRRGLKRASGGLRGGPGGAQGGQKSSIGRSGEFPGPKKSSPKLS